VTPASAVFIDDVADNAAAAEALGVHGIHFRSAYQLRLELVAVGMLPESC
jgi:2-haloacid dehalogenase